MDIETGEITVQDNETGEWMSQLPSYDSETGEPENLNFTFRSKFRIQTHNCTKNATKKLVTRDMSPILLVMLPTLFISPGLATIAIALLEVVIHMWAHRKNKTLVDKGIYYRSPMHVVASEFCARCRDQRTMDKIGKIQDKRAHRFKCHYEYVKRVVT